MKFLHLLFLLPLFCSPLFAGSAAKYLNEEEKALEAFSRTFALIRSQAIPKKTTGELTEAAIRGMLQSIDPYSVLYSRVEYERLQQESMGQYIGIGVQLLPRKKGLTIASVTEKSPAKRAGLKRGDLLTKLNHQTLTPENEQGLFHQLPKKVGHKITLSILRDSQEKEFKLNFAAIKHLSVTIKEVSPQVYLVQISDFQKNTAQEISNYFKNKTIKGLVIDLRNNPGGLLLSAIETAELFIDEGLILDVKNQQGRSTQRYLSHGFSTLLVGKTAVLVNGRTASSAEILAGAIKDLKKGKLFGEQTYGKGSVQSIFAINEDLFAKLTIAKFYTASGKSFHKKGIKPDVAIKDHLSGELYSEEDKIFTQALMWVELR